MSAPELDADGDAVVARRRPAAAADDNDDSGEVHLSEVHLDARRGAGATTSTTFRFAGGAPPPLALRHALATPLAGVGLQVWAGALLADFLLAQGGALAGAAVLELGAGTGLAALAAARAGARHVWATDVSKPVLELAAANAAAAGLAAAARVRRLDWAAPPAWLAAGGKPSGEPSGDEFGWTAADLRELSTCALVVAADCIYDDCLTEAFMRVAASLLALLRRLARAGAPRPRLVVALERRVVFALADLAVRAPAYDFWRTLFSEEGAGRDLKSGALVGRRLDAGAVPRRVLGHARGEALELWELREHDV
jgi:predicted nicotinamide N-methyase